MRGPAPPLGRTSASVSIRGPTALPIGGPTPPPGGLTSSPMRGLTPPPDATSASVLTRDPTPPLIGGPILFPGGTSASAPIRGLTPPPGATSASVSTEPTPPLIGGPIPPLLKGRPAYAASVPPSFLDETSGPVSTPGTAPPPLSPPGGTSASSPMRGPAPPPRPPPGGIRGLVLIGGPTPPSDATSTSISIRGPTPPPIEGPTPPPRGTSGPVSIPGPAPPPSPGGTSASVPTRGPSPPSFPNGTSASSPMRGPAQLPPPGRTSASVPTRGPTPPPPPGGICGPVFITPSPGRVSGSSPMRGPAPGGASASVPTRGGNTSFAPSPQTKDLGSTGREIGRSTSPSGRGVAVTPTRNSASSPMRGAPCVARGLVFSSTRGSPSFWNADSIEAQAEVSSVGYDISDNEATLEVDLSLRTTYCLLAYLTKPKIWNTIPDHIQSCITELIDHFPLLPARPPLKTPVAAEYSRLMDPPTTKSCFGNDPYHALRFYQQDGTIRRSPDSVVLGTVREVEDERGRKLRFFAERCTNVSTERNCCDQCQKAQRYVRESKSGQTKSEKKLSSFEKLEETFPLYAHMRTALEKGILKESHFFYIYLANVFENLTQRKNMKGWRWLPEVVQWALLIQYQAGDSVFDLLKGRQHSNLQCQTVLDDMNLPFPSRYTLQESMPRFQLNEVNESFLKETLASHNQKGHSKQFFLSWDEMDVNDGFIYSGREEFVCGYVDQLARSFEETPTEPISEADIAHKICVFFLVSSDGHFCTPILARGVGKNHFQEEFLEKHCRHINAIFQKCSPNDSFRIVGGIADGAQGNLSFTQNSARTVFGQHFLFIGDFSHLVKRMRNALVNGVLARLENIDDEPIYFSVQTLMAHGKHPELKDILSDRHILSPVDKMDMDPVKKICQPKITAFLRKQENAEDSALADYLEFMFNLYQIFRDEHDVAKFPTWRDWNVYRRNRLQSMLQWLEAWKSASIKGHFLAKELFQELGITLANTIHFLESYESEEINLCSISTLAVEHFFSCIRHKFKRPNCAQVLQATSGAELRRQTILSSYRPFAVGSAVATISKCYNNMKVETNYRFEKGSRSNAISAISREPQAKKLYDKNVVEWITTNNLSPKRSHATIRESTCRELACDVRIKIPTCCPFSLAIRPDYIPSTHQKQPRCNFQAKFCYPGYLKRHLHVEHSPLTTEQVKYLTAAALRTEFRNAQGVAEFLTDDASEISATSGNSADRGRSKALKIRDYCEKPVSLRLGYPEFEPYGTLLWNNDWSYYRLPYSTRTTEAPHVIDLTGTLQKIVFDEQFDTKELDRLIDALSSGQDYLSESASDQLHIRDVDLSLYSQSWICPLDPSISHVFIFDIETTGLISDYAKPFMPCITEIMVIDVMTGAWFYSKVGLPDGETFRGDSRKISGLTEDDLQDQPPIQDVLPRFLEFLEHPNSVLMAHNGTAFDVKIPTCCPFSLAIRPDYIPSTHQKQPRCNFQAKFCYPGYLKRHLHVEHSPLTTEQVKYLTAAALRTEFRNAQGVAEFLTDDASEISATSGNSADRGRSKALKIRDYCEKPVSLRLGYPEFEPYGTLLWNNDWSYYRLPYSTRTTEAPHVIDLTGTLQKIVFDEQFDTKELDRLIDALSSGQDYLSESASDQLHIRDVDLSLYSQSWICPLDPSISHVFIFDIETTGLISDYAKPFMPCITEIMVIDVMTGAWFYSKVGLPDGETFRGDSRKISGLTEDDLQDQPPIQDVLPRFLEFLEHPNSVLMAHNGTAFDVKIVDYHLKQSGLKFRSDLAHVDTKFFLLILGQSSTSSFRKQKTWIAETRDNL
eukprot:TRINITY_DN1326_c0_g2_i5.p1 TRINITY_DN1326_c0_g2~~TRINITY_DN1326_c0_g2_i5.p1  ORF type:complete len:1813 (-),score=279.51 TRINITY_DN1326_c0_g2_i5:2368-7806(-)